MRDYPGLQSQLTATSGYSYEVTIKGTRINKYPSPYSDCTVLADNTLLDSLEDSIYYDRVLQTGYSYSRFVFPFANNLYSTKNAFVMTSILATYRQTSTIV